eukprot:14478970-Alexandrium_andersonii.AAC.1
MSRTRASEHNLVHNLLWSSQALARHRCKTSGVSALVVAKCTQRTDANGDGEGDEGMDSAPGSPSNKSASE